VQTIKALPNCFLETGIDSVLQYEDIKIQTYKWGNGSKKVLLVHGWASHSFRWKTTIEHLTENDFTVYAFDAPAHGLSSGKILHIILYSKIINLYLEKHEDIDNIISHSIGGFAVVYWLYLHKENSIKKVVTMGSPGEAKDFFDFYQTTLGLTDRTMKILTNEFMTLLGYEPSYFSASQFAKALQVKGLIIHDKEDKDTSYENSIRLNDSWKNSKLMLTQGLGHALKSKALLENMVQFILD
jgi:esterase/lipase